MANYAVLKAAINAVIKTNGNKEITGQVLNQTLMAIVDSLGENYQFAGVAVPSTNPGTPDQNIFYLATQAGTYTNFGATVLPAGISMLEWKNNTWSSETFFTIDDAPTAGSDHLVKSGGVKTAIDNVAFSTNEKVKDVGIDSTPTSGSDNLIKSGAVFDAFKNDGGAYDVSVHFPTGGVEGGNTYTLDGAIAMVPQNMKKGGMSIKFVSSSDNKYIQARLMAQNFTTDVTQWQCVDDEPTAGSENLVESGGVAASIINTNSQIGDFLFEDTIVAGTTYNITKDVDLKTGTKIYVTTFKNEGLVVSGILLKDDTENIISSITHANNLEITLARDTTKLTVYIYGDHITSGGSLSVNIRTNITHALDTIPIVIQSVSNESNKVVSSIGVKEAIRNAKIMDLPLVDGNYIDTNGAIQTGESFGYLSIPVCGEAKIRTFVCVNSIDTGAAAAFYDKDGNLVNYTSQERVIILGGYADTECVFTAPANSVLMKVSYRADKKMNLYAYVDLTSAIDDFKDGVEEVIGGLLEVHEPTNYSNLAFYSHSVRSTSLSEEITNNKITITRTGTKGNDTVKVSINGLTVGKEYKFKCDALPWTDDQSYIRIIDGNTQTTLTDCPIVNGKINVTFTPNSTDPQFVIYIRYAEPFTVEFSSISITESDAVSGIIIKPELVKYLDGGIFTNAFASSNNIFNGVDPTTFGGEEMKVFKKGICIGDSLTKGTFNYNSAQGSSTAITDTARNYPQFLAKMLGITIDVFAEGGITTAQWWESFGNGDYSGNDFAIINLGLNDVLKQTGGWNEDSATALGNIINKLKSDNTGIKIFVCNGFPYSAYTNAVTSLAPAISDYIDSLNDTNVILVDTFKYSHVGEDTAYNNYHGTALGYWKIATELKNYISWYIHSNLMEFRAVQFIGTEYVL